MCSFPPRILTRASSPAPPAANADGSYTIATPLTADVIRQLLNAQRFNVSVSPETPSVIYEVSSTPTVLDVVNADRTEHVIHASGRPHFASFVGRYGMQIVGSKTAKESVADFTFKNISIPSANKGTFDFRFRGGIQRTGDYDASQAWSSLAMTVVNHATGKTSPLIQFHPETNRDIPIAVPAEYVAGGDFDVYILGMDNGQWIGMSPTSVQLISAEHSFASQPVKSLLLLWLFSILVVVMAIFTSTFLSWPIAIVSDAGDPAGPLGRRATRRRAESGRRAECRHRPGIRTRCGTVTGHQHVGGLAGQDADGRFDTCCRICRNSR